VRPQNDRTFSWGEGRPHAERKNSTNKKENKEEVTLVFRGKKKTYMKTSGGKKRALKGLPS